MIKRAFPLKDILQVYSGYVLEDGGFSKVQDVLDHFYPGIMTVGCAVMAASAKEEIARQFPDILQLPLPLSKDKDNMEKEELEKYLRKVDKVISLSTMVELKGPLQVSEEEVRQKFLNFGIPI